MVTPTDENCTTGSYGISECSWTGDFVSDDGKTRSHGVDISGGVDTMGKPQAGVYIRTATGPAVYAPHTSLHWINEAAEVVLLVFCGVAWMGTAGWKMTKTWRSRSQA